MEKIDNVGQDFNHALMIIPVHAISGWSICALTFAAGITLSFSQANSGSISGPTANSYSRFLQVPGKDTAPIPESKPERDEFLGALDPLIRQVEAKLKEPDMQTAWAAKAAEFKADTSRVAFLSRLVENQETRVPQPDAFDYLLHSDLLVAVETGQDPIFAQVAFWNEVALIMTSLDHTPVPTNDPVPTYPIEQVGPVKTSRVLAITHLAMYEALEVPLREYKSYFSVSETTPPVQSPSVREEIFRKTNLPATITPADVSMRTAVAFSAYRCLVHLYPMKANYLNAVLAANIRAINGNGPIAENGAAKDAGQAIGEAAAATILAERDRDGAQLSFPDEPPVSNFNTADPLAWRKDPLNADPDRALGAYWSNVKPFAGTRATLFTHRPPAPPPLDLANPLLKETFDKGGDDIAEDRFPMAYATGRLNTPTTRTKILPTDTEEERSRKEEFIGIFWAYDATALLCAPPRLYNMIATSIALKEKNATFNLPDGVINGKNGATFARYLALINLAMADAGVGAWEAKYYYRYPRPVTAIRALSAAGTVGRFWTPLGAPVSNATLGRHNFTPPFPSYPSGHAVFGAALFEVLTSFYGTDAVKFEFVSDEYNGRNRDAGSTKPRLKTKKTFSTFTEAKEENGTSRVYLGIHWPFDATAGYDQGKSIATDVIPLLEKIAP